MGKMPDRQYSILIVSAVEQLNTFVKKNISDRHFTTIEVRKSAALAAQELLNRHYDVIIVNAPLPDNFGVDFVLDICGRYTSGIIILSPGEVADDVTERVIDHGVVVLAKPMTARGLVRNIRHLIAIQNKFHDTEKKLLSMEDKMKEIRIVSQAKCLLVEKEHLTEAEAHSRIGKLAMDRCISRRAVAEEIIDRWE